MDVQDHKKSPSSGHESHGGVLVCHKCGWPFPNPHPSAKHRRAHKRVCGKVEGYKLIDSEADNHASDDEHVSDDDMKTPSPKMEKGSVKEVGGGSDGVGLKSIKSEDDVFSDAVTEFLDSGVSPTVEEQMESIRGVGKNVGEELVHDPNESALSKGNEDYDTTKQVHDLTAGGEISNSEGVGSLMNQLESTKPVSDVRVDEVSSGVDRTEGVPVNSCSAVSETITENAHANGEIGKQKKLINSEPDTDTEMKVSVNEVESFTQCVAPVIKSASEVPLCESNIAEAEEKGSGPVVLEPMVPEPERKTSDTVTMEPELHGTDGIVSHDVTAGETVEQEEELNNKLQAEMENVNVEPVLHEADEKVATVSTGDEDVEQEKELINVVEAEKTKHDLFPHAVPPTCADASVIALVEDDSAKDTVGNGNAKAEVCDSKVERDKEKHMPLVAETLPAIENPEVIIGEFKDYRVLKSSFPVDLGDAEVTRSVGDDDKLTVAEPEPGSISIVPGGGLHSATSGFNSLDHGLEKEGRLAPITGELDKSGSKVISGEASGTNVLEGSPESSGCDKSGSKVISGEASGTNVLEGSPESSGYETQKTQSNYFVEGLQLNAADEESLQNGVSAPSTMAHPGVIPAVSSIHGETCEETTTSSKVEDADDEVVKESDFVRTENGTSDLLGEDNTSSSQKCSDEIYVDASQGLELGKSDEALRSGSTLGVVSELSLKDHSLPSNKQSDNSNDTDAQRSSDVLGAVSPLIPEIRGGVSEKNSEDSISKQPAAFPVASEISNQSSAAGEAGNTRDAIISEPLPDEDGGKLTKEHLNVSIVHNSAVSSSRTESLDGNWGSVSVLSTQSDGTTPPDAVLLSSTGARAPEKSESTLLKPQTAAGGSHHEGRKKNEEIISKVTNWSTGKQHSPLKNLLSEAHAETKVKAATPQQAPDVKQADESAAKKNGAAVTTVSSIMGSETPNNNAAKREMDKEWNSPARYPADIKKEKKKGKPYWVPFVCCTSVHQDM